MPEYIIQLGETIDTTEKVMQATLQVLAKLVPHADDDAIRQVIRELEIDAWAASRTGRPLPGDVSAIRIESMTFGNVGSAGQQSLSHDRHEVGAP